ncbi:PLD nuclease N-terminal domain-containing protein [uncultured Pseudokineococcus sp.]|uniref:PLD nuclease N-terminal domain-containing protein n=1 Tax=uncultured Pseudokineococcus sp. TaxID=1642928 RepID=UPI00261CDC62|nr:PLD nuclease N-terminal domain-containing protein [uncultured Pseudokineococcus sp.]
MLRAVVVLLAVGLAVYAVLDVLRSRDEEISVLGRTSWVVISVVLPVLGPVLWITVGRQRAGGGGGGGGRPPGPLGPDDDPGFLRDLRGRRDDGTRA